MLGVRYASRKEFDWLESRDVPILST